ncbi:hypothetical protein GGI35DRAFT_37418 [Trichoderma velutinum]
MLAVSRALSRGCISRISTVKPSKTTATAFASKAASRLSPQTLLDKGRQTNRRTRSLDLSPHRGPSFRPSSPTSTNALLTVKAAPVLGTCSYSELAEHTTASCACSLIDQTDPPGQSAAVFPIHSYKQRSPAFFSLPSSTFACHRPAAIQATHYRGRYFFFSLILSCHPSTRIRIILHTYLTTLTYSAKPRLFRSPIQFTKRRSQ